MTYTLHGSLQSRDSASLLKVKCVGTDRQEENTAIDYGSQPLSMGKLTEIVVQPLKTECLLNNI
jgi:hypothetical protein